MDAPLQADPKVSSQGRSRWQASSPALCIVALLAAVAALSFLSGGYIFQRTTPVAVVLAGLAIAGVWLARGGFRPSRPYLVGLIAFAAFVVWVGLSILWSTGPDLSWVAFDVAALYLLVMAAIAFVPGGPRQLRLAAHGFGLVVLVVAGYALLGKVTPDLVTHAHVFARLRAPVGYWNVLAMMIVMAIPIILTTASRRALPWWLRGAAASALVLLAITFFFTFSRGGYVALAAALLVYFALSNARLSAFASLVIPVGLVTAVLVGVRHLDTLFTPTADDALRSSQGHVLAAWFVAALALAFAAQALVALAQRRWPLSAHQVRIAGIAVLAVLALTPIAFGIYYFPSHGGLGEWVSAHYHAALSPSGPANDVGRLTSLGTSGRIPWYRAALEGFSHHPITGTGAGAFRFTNYLYRDQPTVVMHSHSQWLNVLSELGIVGFLLFAVAIGGLVVAACARLFADRADPHRGLLAGCQAAIIAFVVHISLDWDWDMAAATIAFLLLAGVSAAYVRERATCSFPTSEDKPVPPSSRSLLGLRLVATAMIVFGVVSWALPYVAERQAASALDELSRGDIASAQAAARRASGLDPLAVDPLFVLASAQARDGDLAAAEATLERAVRLQPDNYAPYYEMGSFQLEVLHDRRAAQPWYRRALQLNPLDAAARRMVDRP